MRISAAILQLGLKRGTRGRMAAADGHDPMQRVRVGLTGLAFVLLIVALVSVIFDAASDEAPVVPQPDLANMMMQAPTGEGNAATGEEEKPADPIAELGVAPSSATTDANDSEPVAPPPVQPTLPRQGARR